MTITDFEAATLADRLHAAAAEHRLIPPLTDETPMSPSDAYAVQDALVERMTADGARCIGAKLGLTSQAKQREMGVGEPVYGWLTDRMALEPGELIATDSLGQPRVEPEIAFVIGADLEDPAATAATVLGRTEAVMPALEILDSRYKDYRFTLADVVADNTSSGRFVLGEPTSPAGIDLALIGCVFEHSGEIIGTAAGGAVLDHPARAVAWLARRLAERGRGLRRGDIVLSGGMMGASKAAPGDVFTATFDRLGSVTVYFK